MFVYGNKQNEIRVSRVLGQPDPIFLICSRTNRTLIVEPKEFWDTGDNVIPKTLLFLKHWEGIDKNCPSPKSPDITKVTGILTDSSGN
jgi:hypothetical protein